MKVAIVDYGMGNIRSIAGALKFLEVEEIVLTSSFEELQQADRLILPGVGSFGKAIGRIRTLKLDHILDKLVLIDKRPILGICLGMQLMGKYSNEDGQNYGLGFVDARVERFENENLLIPHVGFNQVRPFEHSRLFDGIVGQPDFYFTHSYRLLTDSFEENYTTCDYGSTFVASFEKENVAGVQFHPELSQTNGLRLLRNFLDKF
ncbi:imidazole glycerol phosphate synthase subunit HisH [Sphingobacterium sp. InxBP1]|uniref:imidazole glycerol phosphate synthase subunit HisH n=1 Tax=Sphingobacterium sp. InxBP1 TaxID=2870328 RepID=UPI0022438BC9|nr:imidazole glycerol phosphate synthase subunit HisH [Sphingobacterium sp. InxBP1]MCW8310899.1 imidazole glycerol phosphate synthase subunit HisH [Sphingobacterium sp. InxBP1]